MMHDHILIEFSWNSGPYGTWHESPDKKPHIAAPQAYSENHVIPIPRTLWERYEKAKEELYAAEDALNEVEQAYVKAHQP